MNRFEELREKILPVLLPHVKQVAVFGSFARGDDTRESNIDILVELKPLGERPTIGLRWFGLEEELSRVLERKVDLIGKDRSRSLHSTIRGKRNGGSL